MLRLMIGLAGFLLATPVFGGVPCSGDCNGDEVVSVDELLRGINILLERAPLEVCPAADLDSDGAVFVSEVVAAIGAALNGCAPAQPVCGDGNAEDPEECDDGNVVSGDGCTADCQLELGGDMCAGVAAHPGVNVTAVLVADRLEMPTHITAPPLDPHRLFIVEQRGRIRIVKDGTLLSDPFLAIEENVSCCFEQGLLSVAFHPDFESNGRFFVNYTNRDGDTVVARYDVSADPDRADAPGERILLTIPQPFFLHNGGQLAFGPDGYLYVGMGDGGSGGEAGQDDETLLGKLLRVDVNVEAPPYHAVPEDNPSAQLGLPLGLIWAKGLRNPWRFSFDRQSDDLYIADVGQSFLEEVDVQPADSAGGENYGWDIFEGTDCFEPDPLPDCPDPASGFTFPVVEYTHAEGCSITGGFAYRGCALPDLHGTYFYGDFCSAFIRSFVFEDGAATQERDWTTMLVPGDGRTIDLISTFGEDARGELYIADYSDGEVFKIIPAP